jgi:WD40 repeat protein
MLNRGGYRAVLQEHTGAVNDLAFTPDDRSLLSASYRTLRVWDVMSGRCVRVMQGYPSALFDVDWSPDGTQLVSSGSDALVTIYDVAGRIPPQVLRGHSGVVCGVGWSSDGRRLVSTEWENPLRMWDPTSGDCLELLHNPETTTFFCSVAWSPEGHD